LPKAGCSVKGMVEMSESSGGSVAMREWRSCVYEARGAKGSLQVDCLWSRELETTRGKRLIELLARCRDVLDC
jgi:hypothetical protein